MLGPIEINITFEMNGLVIAKLKFFLMDPRYTPK